jgi:hypothetical protein
MPTPRASPPAFVMTTLMHDVPPEVAEQVMATGEPPQAGTSRSNHDLPGLRMIRNTA